MAFALIFPIRAIQALFALIMLGLTAYSEFDDERP